MNGLLQSRKFWLFCFGCIVSSVALAIGKVTWEQWLNFFAALSSALGISIALEDAGMKAGGGKNE